MRNSSKTMYKIGRIFSFVLLGLYALLLGIYSILLIVDIIRDNAIGHDISTIVFSVIMIGLTVVCIIMATKSIKDMEQDTKNNSPHIMMIVFGALCGDVFYVLGGIFGLIANGQEQETKKEESKE